jgi:integrase
VRGIPKQARHAVVTTRTMSYKSAETPAVKIRTTGSNSRPSSAVSCCATSCGGPCVGRVLPPLRFHDLRHMAGTLMHETGVPLKRAADPRRCGEHTTLAIYTHAMRRTRDDSADKIAELAGLSNVGNKIGLSHRVRGARQ